MSKWDMVRLGDVCRIISGSTPKTGVPEYWDGDIKWITPAEIKSDSCYIQDTERHITELGKKSTGLHLMPKGTVLLSSRAPIGKVAIAVEEMCCNQGFKNLICSSQIHNKYLYYFLKKNTHLLNSLGNGATFKEISKKIVEKIVIPLPPLDEQRRIAESLDLASSLIEKRKKQIELLDLLAKSLFVEMFGDPVENPMGWEVVQLKDITTKIGSGATPRGGKESYKTEGIHLIRSMNVHNGRFKLLDLAFIDEKQASQLDNVIVEKDDVLINITGASVARSCIVPDNILPARVNQHVSIIRLNKKFANSQFINNVFVNINYQQKLLSLSNAGGATREAITKSQLEKLETILPPVDLQIQFANVIEAIETQKSLLQNGLEKLEMNSKALMQKYFEET